MTDTNRATLDRHRHHHFTLVNAQYMKGLNVHEREDMLRVAREEFFGAGYSPDMFCPKCVADFVLALYRAYDNFLEVEKIKEAGTIISDAPLEWIPLPGDDKNNPQ